VIKRSFVFTALLGLTFVSCKKEYSCYCDGGTSVPDQTYILKESSQADAEATCSSFDDNSQGAVACSIQ